MTVPMDDRMSLEPRLIHLQSWWVASELTRRQPDLGLIETHPGGGTYDCLSIIRWCPQPDPFIDLNRNGSLHVHPDHIGALTWTEESQAEDRRFAVRRLEELAELPAPAKTPRTTPQTLTHRLVYQLLLLGLNDRRPWHIRNARVDSSAEFSGTGALTGFRSAERSCESRFDDPLRDPLYRFWKISVGSEVVVVLDIDGQAHFSNGTSQDLYATFNEEDRSIEAVAVGLRRHILTT